jgi:hypothetical protein
MDENELREFKALTEIPEKMGVGDLNQAVKDLREMLHQEKIKNQELKKSLNWLKKNRL